MKKVMIISQFLVWYNGFVSNRNFRYLHVFIQLLCYRQGVMQGHFLNGVKLAWIQIFPSLRVVDKPRLKNKLPNYFPIVDAVARSEKSK